MPLAQFGVGVMAVTVLHVHASPTFPGRLGRRSFHRTDGYWYRHWRMQERALRIFIMGNLLLEPLGVVTRFHSRRVFLAPALVALKEGHSGLSLPTEGRTGILSDQSNGPPANDLPPLDARRCPPPMILGHCVDSRPLIEHVSRVTIGQD